MFEKFDELEILISKADLQMRVMILIICIVAGIALSKFIFANLKKTAVRLNIGTYPLIQKALKGMPTLWGFLIGGYFALHILSVAPRGLVFLQNALHTIGILSLTIMSARILSAVLNLKFQKTVGTFASTSILVTTIELVVYITGLLFLLQTFDVSITPLLTALGVGGLAVALALQDTLTNLFSGINILLSKQIKMGDYIKLSTGEEGVVADMNWRNTNIMLSSDNLLVVPNQKIATAILTNFSLPNEACFLSIPVLISYGSDLEKVEKVTSTVAKEVLQEFEGGLGSVEPFVRYSIFAESSITFIVTLRIKSVTHENVIRHEFLKRLYFRFRQESIMMHT